MSYSLVSSISLEDDNSSTMTTPSISVKGSASNKHQNNPSGSSSKELNSTSNKSNVSLMNEVFLRTQYLDERAKKLRKRLADRPFDERALVEYAEVTYEQKNFLVSQKIIKRVLATGDCSGYWYLRLGKCCFRRWLIYAQATDLEEALECYRIAMKDPGIHRDKARYFEIAMMNIRLGRHQVALDVLSTFMVLFKNENDWISVAEYIVALIIFTKGLHQQSLQLLRDLNISDLHISIDRGPDHIFYLPYHLNNISIELEIAAIHDAMGDKKLSRNLLFELWNQVEKYRKHGNAQEFDFQLGSKNFKEWYNDHKTFGSLGDHYCNWNNLVFAAEMYRMAIEKLLKLKNWTDIWAMDDDAWDKFTTDDQEEAFRYLLARAECLWNSGSQIESEKCALCVFYRRPDDILLTGKAAKCVRPSNREALELIKKATNIEKSILLVQSKARIRVARAEQKKREFAVKAEYIVTAFIKMCLVRNRLVEERLANCPVLHINHLVRSLLTGRIGVMKSGKLAIENWVEIWYYSAVTIQTFFQKWLRRQKYGRFFKGIRAFERLVRGQITRSRLRKYIQAMQNHLDQTPNAEIRGSLNRRADRRMNINYEIVTRICCGTTCVTSEEYILGTVPLNSVGSPLRLKSRTERKLRGSTSMLPPHRKPMWEKIEWFGDIAKRSTDSPQIDSSPSDERPYTSEAIKEYANTHPDEDVISFISYASVKTDVTKQWVPFGILPDREIQRAIQCTVLVIASPSFSCPDANRLAHVVERDCVEAWRRLRALFIYGTRMGPSGLRHILSLGISHLQTFTIGQTGMSHHFGGYLGGQLVQSETYSSLKVPESISSNSMMSLYKIYIEQEPGFGDRGIISLLKCLQFNRTMKILVCRGCNITNRGAIACAKYVGISQTIENINLGDNCLSRDGYLSLIRAVATKGSRGKLKNISIRDQSPGYASHEELLELYHLGVELGIKMMCEDITPMEEISFELFQRKNTDQEDIQHMRKVFHDIVNDDRVENEEILTTSYKKIIYL